MGHSVSQSEQTHVPGLLLLKICINICGMLRIKVYCVSLEAFILPLPPSVARHIPVIIQIPRELQKEQKLSRNKL